MNPTIPPGEVKADIAFGGNYFGIVKWDERRGNATEIDRWRSHNRLETQFQDQFSERIETG